MNTLPPGAIGFVETRCLLAIIGGARTYQQVSEGADLHMDRVRVGVGRLIADGIVTCQRRGRWVHDLRATVGGAT